MGIFDRFFGRNADTVASNSPSLPWNQPPSIFDFLRAHIDPNEPGLPWVALKLPDQERYDRDLQSPSSPGLTLVNTEPSIASQSDEESIAKVVGLIALCCKRSTVNNQLALYNSVISLRINSIINGVLKKLREIKGLNYQYLYDLAYSFATKASDREPVKLGLGLLCIFTMAANESIFLTLGRHGEFTHYCAAALGNQLNHPDDLVWELARNADSAGRANAISYLAGTRYPSIKNWVLREGFRVGMDDSSVALACAKAGELLAALNQQEVDRGLLTSTGGILHAMIIGSPPNPIDHYEHASQAVELFLGHMAASAETLMDFRAVHQIHAYLSKDHPIWTERYQSGWTRESRDRLLAVCTSLLDRPDWPKLIRTALSEDKVPEATLAVEAAQIQGIDIWDFLWNRVRDNPFNPMHWQSLMTQCTRDRVTLVTDLVLTKLDLGSVDIGAASPSESLHARHQHLCFSFVLEKLDQFSGQGAQLIEVGLKAPLPASRYLALMALKTWPRATWTETLAKVLDQAAKCEPFQKMRRQMEQLLRGAE